MPEGTPPARGAGRARGRGATRGRGGRGGAASVTQSADAPLNASTSRPSSALGTASATGAPLRDSATPKPTRGTSVGRFRPKNVRRDEAARDVLARQELEKDNARAKAEARAQARSRGRSRRARGDAMGRGGFMSRAAVASGPFSQINIEGMLAFYLTAWDARLTLTRGCKVLWRLGWRRRRWRRRWVLRRRRGKSKEGRRWLWGGIWPS